jgi:ABC-type branched-subunit amino acid transport system substrate-binding protein
MSKAERIRGRWVAIVLLLGLIGTACSGRFPARLAEKGSQEVKTISLPAPEDTPTETVEAAAQQPGQQAAGRATQPRRVLGRTAGGTTVSLTESGLPIADIWPADQDRVGISNTEIKLCMHAAFLLGPVFNNHPDDEGVYWDVVNATGGVHGRKVSIRFTDDQYVASGTTAALDQCKQTNPFLYMGGVGFDQAPAGRAWAETNKLPYLYNLAVEASNLKYSFSFLPSIEKNGRLLGEFVGSRFQGKTVGVIYVDSDNWRAGYREFESAIKKRGMSVKRAEPITSNNHPDFGAIILQMQRDGVDLVLAYINALALNRFIVQADGQLYYPVVVSPDGFDLVTDASGNGTTNGDGTDYLRRFPGVYAGWVSPAYETGPPNEKARPSVPWNAEMEAMKNAYKKYRPSKVPNDVDWMFWLAMKTVHQMLADCSKDCSRNILAGLMLTGYKTNILDCPIDFSMGGGRVGGHYHNIYKSEAVGERSYWRQIETCKKEF